MSLYEKREALLDEWEKVHTRVENGTGSDNDAEYLASLGDDIDELEEEIEEDRREWELDQMIQDWEDTKQSMMGDI
jgi:hypothetical protein